MRALKMIAGAFALFVVLPVVTVAVLGIAFSPLQTAARATEPRFALEASDIMWNGEAAAAEPERGLEPGSKSESGFDSGFDSGPTPEVVAGAELESAFGSGSEPEPEQGLEAIAASGDDEPVPGDARDALDGGSASGSSADQPGFPEGVSGSAPARYSSDDLRVLGVICDGAYRYTWYSQRVLPGGGLDIEGRHVSGEGYVVDGQERIVVASSDLPKGTELEIPFGSGRAIVLDTGCAPGTLDIYTDF